MKVIVGNYTLTYHATDWMIQLHNLTLHGYLTVNLLRLVPHPHPDGRSKSAKIPEKWAQLVVAGSQDAHTLADQVRRMQCPAGVLADWLDDHKEQWSQTENPEEVVAHLRQCRGEPKEPVY